MNSSSPGANLEQREGLLFVVSAPSGTGKTSLCRDLIDSAPDLSQSVSFTTRPKRIGEVDGVDYHFIDRPQFQEMVAGQRLAEWAEVHDQLYGTGLETLEQGSAAGTDLLLDIDCQGAAQLKENYRRGIYIFILPPDFAELEKRLRRRGTEEEAVIRRRLANARLEIRQAGWYDYIVVNDDFSTARERLQAIVLAERSRRDGQRHWHQCFSP